MGGWLAPLSSWPYAPSSPGDTGVRLVSRTGPSPPVPLGKLKIPPSPGCVGAGAPSVGRVGAPSAPLKNSAPSRSIEPDLNGELRVGMNIRKFRKIKVFKTDFFHFIFYLLIYFLF